MTTLRATIHLRWWLLKPILLLLAVLVVARVISRDRGVRLVRRAALACMTITIHRGDTFVA